MALGPDDYIFCSPLQVESLDALASSDEHQSSVLSIRDNGPLPDEECSRASIAKALWREVNSLPEKQQKVIRGITQEATMTRIASDLSISVAAVSHLRNRAFANLRQRLSPILTSAH